MNAEELIKELQTLPDEMTSSERYAAYARGEEVDHIPFYYPGNGSTLAPLYGYTIEQYRSDFEIHCKVMDELHNEFGNSISASANMGLKGVGEAVGSLVVYPANSIDYISDYILKDYKDLESLRFEPASNAFLQKKLNHVYALKKHYGDSLPVGVSVAGPLSTAASIREPESILKDMRKNKDNLHKLLAFSTSCALTWVETCKKEFGKVSAGIADPVSSSTIISPNSFREFSKPYLKELVQGITEITGSAPGLHICGKTKPIWEDLLELGIDEFSVDNCEDLSELKNSLGRHMTISGNVPPVEVMLNGSIDDVIESVRQCLLKASDSPNGFILDVGCQLPIGTPRENVYAYIYAAKKYGRHAKKGQLCGGLL